MPGAGSRVRGMYWDNFFWGFPGGCGLFSVVACFPRFGGAQLCIISAPCGANQRVTVKMDLIRKWLRGRARGECVRGGGIMGGRECVLFFRLLVVVCVNVCVDACAIACMCTDICARTCV